MINAKGLAVGWSVEEQQEDDVEMPCIVGQ
jgi:hypothetical protein